MAHEYGTTQINFDGALAQAILSLGSRIPDALLAGDGREAEPHATVLYGLDPTVTAADVQAAIGDFGPIFGVLGTVQKFTGAETDVLYVSLALSNLPALHDRLAGALAYTETQASYVPHITLAYVAPGQGDAFLGNTDLAGHPFVLTQLTVSAPGGERTVLPLVPGQAVKGEVPMGTIQRSARLVCKAVDDEQGIIEGHASIFGNVDATNDMVMAGAFKRTCEHWKQAMASGSKKMPLLWQHDSQQPIGVITDLGEDTQGLAFKARLVLSTQRGREAYELAKAGAISGVSFRAKVLKDDVDYTTGVTKLQEMALSEISLATFPANELAGITTVKSEDGGEVAKALLALAGALKVPLATPPALPAAPPGILKAAIAAAPARPADEVMKGLLADQLTEMQFEEQVNALQDDLWSIDHAFRCVTRETIEDTQMTAEQKMQILDAALTEYGTLRKAWAQKWLALQAQIAAAQAQSSPANATQKAAPESSTPPAITTPAPELTTPADTIKAEAPTGLTPITIPDALPTSISPEDVQELLKAAMIPADTIAAWSGIDLPALKASQTSLQATLTEITQQQEIRQAFAPLNQLATLS